MEDKQIFNVPARNMEWLENKVAKLNKKATKLGVGGLEIVRVSHVDTKDDKGVIDRVFQVVVEGEVPHIEGYQFVARIDHNTDPTGKSNLVYVMPKETLPEVLRYSPAECDHCNWMRNRRTTYILFKDATGAFIQVGSTCLGDFFNGNPDNIAKKAEWIVTAKKLAKEAIDREGDGNALNDHRHFDLETYLSFVALEIEDFRWVSGKEAWNNEGLNSTASVALSRMLDDEKRATIASEKPTEQNIAQARASIRWAASQDKSKSDFWHNVVTIAETKAIGFKATGTAAAIVSMYIQHRDRELENEQEEAEDLSGSEHFAAVKDKIRCEVRVIGNRLLPLRDFQEFQTRLVRMVTVKGDNLVVTFATGKFNPELGSTTTIRGTVSKLDDYNGVKQTIIKRAAEVA